MEIMYRGLNMAELVPIRLYFYGTKKASDQLEDLLHTAIREGKFDEAIKIIDDMEHGDPLLNKYAVDPEINHSHPPVLYAARYGSVEVLKKLIAKGADVTLERDCPKTNINALHPSQRHHNGVGLEICKALLEAGVKASSATSCNVTAIYSSIMWNNVAVANLLLEHGADPNAHSINHEADRPIFMAAAHGNEAILRLLVEEYGADPNVVGASGFNVYHFSLVSGNTALIKACADFNGVGINDFSRSDDTPLSLACKLPNDLVKNQMITEILKHGGEAELDTPDGPPILIAISNGKWDAVESMLNHYKTTKPQNLAILTNCRIHVTQVTPLVAAIRKGHAHTVELLLANEADIHKRDVTGSTPLIEAVRMNEVELVYMLIEAEAKIEVVNNSNDSALSIATQLNFSACAELCIREWMRKEYLMHNNSNSSKQGFTHFLSQTVISRMKSDILQCFTMSDLYDVELLLFLMRTNILSIEDLETVLSADQIRELHTEINWSRRKSYVMFHSGYRKSLVETSSENKDNDNEDKKSPRDQSLSMRDVALPLIFKKVIKYL